MHQKRYSFSSVLTSIPSPFPSSRLTLSRFVEIVTYTWAKDSHGLFDYESPHLFTSSFKISGSAQFFRKDNDIFMLDTSSNSSTQPINHPHSFLFEIKTESSPESVTPGNYPSLLSLSLLALFFSTVYVPHIPPLSSKDRLLYKKLVTTRIYRISHYISFTCINRLFSFELSRLTFLLESLNSFREPSFPANAFLILVGSLLFFFILFNCLFSISHWLFLVMKALQTLSDFCLTKFTRSFLFSNPTSIDRYYISSKNSPSCSKTVDLVVRAIKKNGLPAVKNLNLSSLSHPSFLLGI